MKIVKLKVRSVLFGILVLLLAPGMQGCAPPQVEATATGLRTSTPGVIPLWTPRPIERTQTALPTGTRLAPDPTATSLPPNPTVTAPIEATPTTVRVMIEGGNLFVHRGPGLAYNYVGVLYDGVTVLATGRDRVSRWIRIALPDDPLEEGWITTETRYTEIEGDIPNLPYIETEPARPAFIRNCTDHELVVRPVGIKLLASDNEPYNEERFNVGTYQVYDLENPKNKPIEQVDLSEGETVEIQYDWTGEKSKCE